MDANETLSTTGSHVGKVTALPVQEELSSCLTAAWQAHGAAHLDGRQTRTFFCVSKHRVLPGSLVRERVKGRLSRELIGDDCKVI